MGHTCFDVEITDKVGHIKMNRPEKANSMIAEFWNELPEIVDEMSASGAVRAVVLSGEGRHFCSGMALQPATPSTPAGAANGSARRR
jgi:enoyl-CoA hydratase